MLQLLLAILGVIVTILLVVGIHEYGHFLLARLVGVKVLRFSIGFGKPFYTWHDKKGTEYALAPIPLGGYVKLLDETEEEVDPKESHLAFNRQPFYKKFLIVAAGPFFNVIFAFALYWFIFIWGFSNILPLVGKVEPNSIAAAAGMHPQEQIIRIDDRQTNGWVAVIIHLLARTGDKNTLTIETKNPENNTTHIYSLNLAQWQMDDLKPNPLDSLGIIPYMPVIPPIVGEIQSDSPAIGKLQSNDKILAIDNEPIDDWMELMSIVSKKPDSILNFKIERQGKIIQLPIQIGSKRVIFKKHGYLGVVSDYKIPPNFVRKNKYGPLQALGKAWGETIDFCHLNLIVLGKLVTGKISFASLGGPITIFESAGTALNHGIIPFLSFLAFLSISIGLINIVPIPGLDGGLIFFHFIELLLRRPIPMRVMLLFYRLGFIVLMLIIVQALVNDILRL